MRVFFLLLGFGGFDSDPDGEDDFLFLDGVPSLPCAEDMVNIILDSEVYSGFSALVIDESTGNFIVPNDEALGTFTDLCKSEPGSSVVEASKYYGTDFICGS